VTRRARGPWYGRDRDCIRFDATARSWPGLRIERRAGRVYRLRLEVPHYEARNVEIRFEDWSRIPIIKVDGPGSRHRYSDGSLCIWYPEDPPEQKWVFDDGLLMLINHVQAHLFREAWWRETGEWLGPEAPHGPRKEPAGEKAERREREVDGRRPRRQLGH
jgi:hypothetical protein